MSAVDFIVTDRERCWATGQMVACLQAGNGAIPAVYASDLDDLEQRLMETGQMHLVDELAVELAFWMAFGTVFRP
jgi:hypothetical protein